MSRLDLVPRLAFACLSMSSFVVGCVERPHRADVSAPDSEMWPFIAPVEAMDEHLVHDRFTPALAVRVLERFVQDYMRDAGDMLGHEDLLAIDALRASVSPERLVRALEVGDYGIFERIAERMTAAQARAAEVGCEWKAIYQAALAHLEGRELQGARSLDERLAMLPYLRRMVFEVLYRASLHETAENAAWTATFRVLVAIQEAREATEERLSDRILEAMFATFDPHSAYLPYHLGDVYREAVEATHPSSVGLVFGRDWTRRGLPIALVVPGSPAARAGVRPGDRVASVACLSAIENGTAAMERALREDWLGPPSLEITGSLDSEMLLPRTLDLVPEPLPWSALHLATFRTRVAERSVLTIGLRHVYPGAAHDVRAAVERELTHAPVDAIVLDLRSNTGGVWTEALDLASTLIDHGPLLQVVKRGGRFAEPARGGPVLYPGPVVVAVDGATEGAPEALALALQGRGRAIVVGAPRTFGHGTWQEYRQPRVFAAIALTVGRFHSVTGYSPQGVGVPSDVVIDGPVSSPSGGGEAALEGALPNEVLPPVIEIPCRGLTDELIETLERRLDAVHGGNADPTWLGQLDAIAVLAADYVPLFEPESEPMCAR